MAEARYLPIILGSDENAYGTARMFRDCPGAAKPLLLCAQQLRATRDSALFDVRIVPGLDRDAVFPDALAGVLADGARYPDGCLAIPCSDYYTGLLCRWQGRFDGQLRNRFNPPELLETFDTKDRFYALCERCGLDYPKTVVCAPEERGSILDRLPFAFPLVMKPENSNASDYLHCKFEGAKKVYFLSDRAAGRAVLDKLDAAGYRGKLIFQEFIPGGDDAMRVLNSYSDGDGRVRAMCLGQPLLEFYDPPSIGNYAAIISRADRALCERLQAFLETIGYVGFANIDMKFDRRTGRTLLFEINPRLGRSSFFACAAGMNFMRVLVEDVIEGRKGPCLYNEGTALWAHVPRGVLRRYVKDPALRREALRLPVHYTLWWEGDRNPRRALRLLRYGLGQYRSFRRWYFDKSKSEW